MTLRQAILLAAITPLLWALGSEQDLLLRSNVRVVEVSIVATDAKGAPVEGLQAKDLQIWDNGKEQTIASFEKIRSAMPAIAAGLPPRTYSNRIGNAGQIGKAGKPQILSLILLDAINTKYRLQTSSRTAVENILAKMGPEELVAVYALGAHLTTIHDFSADKASLLAKVKAYPGESSAYESSLPDFGFGESGHTDGRPPSVMAALDAERILGTLKALEIIAGQMKGIEGRKNLLWVSGGFPMATDGFFGENPRSPYFQQFTPQVRRSLSILSDANVSVYPIDARGLPAGKNSTGAAANIVTMKVVADATGGKAFYNRNDISEGVRTALDDSRVVYELTYTPQEVAADGSYHAIRVACSRKDVHLRYRQGYNAPGKEEPDAVGSGDRLKELVAAPLDASEIGIQATLEPASDASNEVHIVVHIDPTGLNLIPNAEKWTGALRLEAMQLGAAGELLGGVQQSAELNLEQASYRRALQEGLPLDIKIPRAPDATAVRIGVVDERGGHVGSVSVPLTPAH